MIVNVKNKSDFNNALLSVGWMSVGFSITSPNSKWLYFDYKRTFHNKENGGQIKLFITKYKTINFDTESKILTCDDVIAINLGSMEK